MIGIARDHRYRGSLCCGETRVNPKKRRPAACAVPVSGMNPTIGTCDKQVQMIGIACDHRYRGSLCCGETRVNPKKRRPAACAVPVSGMNPTIGTCEKQV